MYVTDYCGTVGSRWAMGAFGRCRWAVMGLFSALLYWFALFAHVDDFFSSVRDYYLTVTLYVILTEALNLIPSASLFHNLPFAYCIPHFTAWASSKMRICGRGCQTCKCKEIRIRLIRTLDIGNIGAKLNIEKSVASVH